MLTDEAGGLIVDTDNVCRVDFAKDWASAYVNYTAQRLWEDASAPGAYIDMFTQYGEGLGFSWSESLGRPLAGGDDYNRERMDVIRTLRDHMRLSGREPEYFVYSESQDEYFVNLLELTYMHPTLNPLVVAASVGNYDIVLAPLFPTVFNDYQFTGISGGTNYPTVHSPEHWAELRRTAAATTFLGALPMAGAQLSAQTITQQVAAAPDAELFYDLQQRLCALFRDNVVHDRVFLGQRLRDPGHDAITVDHSPQFLRWLPYGRQQPLVYVSAWGEYGGDIGLLLVNWTTANDALSGGIAGGDQDVIVDFSLAEHGLTAGDYRETVYASDGSRSTQIVTIYADHTLRSRVPEADAVFVGYEKM